MSSNQSKWMSVDSDDWLAKKQVKNLTRLPNLGFRIPSCFASNPHDSSETKTMKIHEEFCHEGVAYIPAPWIPWVYKATSFLAIPASRSKSFLSWIFFEAPRAPVLGKIMGILRWAMELVN